MPKFGRDPFKDFLDIQDEVNRLFRRGFMGECRTRLAPGDNAWAPAVDVYETKRNLVLLVELPGLTAQDIDIAFDDGVLRISGVRRVPSHTTSTSSSRRLPPWPDEPDATCEPRTIHGLRSNSTMTGRLVSRPLNRSSGVPVLFAGSNALMTLLRPMGDSFLREGAGRGRSSQGPTPGTSSISNVCSVYKAGLTWN